MSPTPSRPSPDDSLAHTAPQVWVNNLAPQGPCGIARHLMARSVLRLGRAVAEGDEGCLCEEEATFGCGALDCDPPLRWVPLRVGRYAAEARGVGFRELRPAT